MTFRSPSAAPVRAFEPERRQAEPERGQDAGQHHGGARRLQVRRQRQYGVLERAAEHPRAVPGAVHPQALHLRDDRDDARTHVCAHLPVGQQCGDRGAQDAEQSQHKAEDLRARGRHLDQSVCLDTIHTGARLGVLFSSAPAPT